MKPSLWRLRVALQTVYCGRHSGIPLCCIAWFVGPWRLLHGWPRNAYFNAIPQGFDHIGCPRCMLRNRPVIVRDCACPRLEDPFTNWLLDLRPQEGV